MLYADRGHPVRERAKHAPYPPKNRSIVFAGRAQADKMSAIRS